MKLAEIDIGSNSMRLTLYQVLNDKFKILFREKIMAGLAGYVESGILTSDGISQACNGLLSFKETLDALKIKDVYVFATASLRNISNTLEAVKIIKEKTGFDVDVLSGKQEAELGYLGALQQLSIKEGVYVDIGGASSEVVTFKDGEIKSSISYPIGSLSLYKKCVKDILPGKKSLDRIDALIKETIKFDKPNSDIGTLIAVGGSARGILKLAKKYYGLDEKCNVISDKQLRKLESLLCNKNKDLSDLILKLEPERIHTIVPGYLVLIYIFNNFNCKEVIVSKYGVREGYLCQKRLMKATPIHKIEN